MKKKSKQTNILYKQIVADIESPQGFSNNLAVSLVAIAMLGVGLGAGYMFFGKANISENSDVVSPSMSAAPMVSASPSVSTSPQANNSSQANWDTYSNSTFGFSIQYPQQSTDGKWESKEYDTDSQLSVGFRPVSMKEDFAWSVHVYDKKLTDQFVKEIGNQFKDRKESRANITMNGMPATLVTITTAQYPTWIYTLVIVEKNNRYYAIGNGALENVEFERFYKSFKLSNN